MNTTLVHNKTTLVLEARMKSLHYTFLSIYLGCNHTQKSWFGMYISFGVMVRYEFGKTGNVFFHLF